MLGPLTVGYMFDVGGGFTAALYMLSVVPVFMLAMWPGFGRRFDRRAGSPGAARFGFKPGPENSMKTNFFNRLTVERRAAERIGNIVRKAAVGSLS